MFGINDYKEEINIIKSIALSNGYNTNIIDKLIIKHKNNINTRLSPINENNNKTYIAGNYTNNVPNILKSELSKININVMFRTNNNISKIIKYDNKIEKKKSHWHLQVKMQRL